MLELGPADVGVLLGGRPCSLLHGDDANEHGEGGRRVLGQSEYGSQLVIVFFGISASSEPTFRPMLMPIKPRKQKSYWMNL